MNIQTLDNEKIRSYIPNVLLEVEGEELLSEKLANYISAAKDWLEQEYLGPEDFLSDDDNELALSVVVLKAYADAVPSLDLVVTPTGFGVVNTETIAPASKERVERLIDTLRSRIDGALDMLFERIRLYPEWRSSERGAYFCSTFLYKPSLWKKDKFFDYAHMRDMAVNVESLMASRYLGHNLMARLREDFVSRDNKSFNELAAVVSSAVNSLVYAFGKPLEKLAWYHCRQIVEMLPRFPEYQELWKSEMGNLFDGYKFDNNIKGSFYF